MRIHLHKLVAIVLGGLLALTPATGSGCGFLVKHVAGKAAMEVAKSGYKSLKGDHEKKSRADRRESRDRDGKESQGRRGDSADNAAGDAGQTGSEDE